jgi:hypothetical protein
MQCSLYGSICMLDESALISKIDTNLFSLYVAAARKSNKTYVCDSEYSFVDLSPSPWGKVIFDIHVEDDSACDRLKENIVNKKIPNSIHTGPTAWPENINDVLEKSGFVTTRTAYGRTLQLDQKIDIDTDPDFTCKTITEESDVRIWAGIVTQHLFNADEKLSDHFSEIVSKMLDSNVACILGYYKGMPVTSSLLFIDEDNIAGYYFVATVDAYRKKGFGSLITDYSMNVLKEKNIQYSILQATELGRPVYEKIGFKEKCTLGRYTLSEI